MYLKVSKFSSLLCVLSWCPSTRDRCSKTMVSRVAKSEGVSICGETYNQLLSWGSLTLPVVYCIVLAQSNYR